MCGRYTLSKTDSINHKVRANVAPSFNIAPSQDVLIFAEKYGFAKWGFTPEWSKKPITIINARSETFETKATFRGTQRCVFIADGWFEWDQNHQPKKPHFFHLNFEIFYFGGILANKGCAIVTRPAHKKISHIHPRQPTILDRNQALSWLNGETIFSDSLSNKIDFFPVSTYVNAPENNDANCIKNEAL